MDAPFPFLNDVEKLIVKYEISLEQIPQAIENKGGLVVDETDIATAQALDDNLSRIRKINPSVETPIIEGDHVISSSSQGSGSIIYKDQISTVKNANSDQNAAERELIAEEAYNFKNVEVFRSLSDALIFDVISKLCNSVLSGEILKSDNSLMYVDSLIKKLENIIVLKSTDLSSDFNQVLFGFVETVKFCLENYYKLIEFINVNYSNDRFENFFVLEKRSNDFIKNLSDNIRKGLNLFFVVLELTTEDLLLNSDFSEFRDIKSILEVAKEFEGEYPNITEVIKLKANFLLYKWYQRYIKDISTTGDFRFRVGKEVLNSKSHTEKDPNFGLWNEKIYFHYEFYESAGGYNRYIKNVIINENDYSKISLLDIHSLIKYYKDISPSKEKLYSIVDYLLKLNVESESKYDQYCLEIIRDYGVNNYFSLCSENKDLALESYNSLYNRCCGLLSGSSNNYFLQFKYLNFVLDQIERETSAASSDKLSEVYHKFYNLVEGKYANILDEYYRKKNWAKSKNNYIFLLPSKESLIKINIENSELESFIVFSSFVLPYNNDEIELNYSKTRQKFREVKSQLKVLGNLRYDLNKLENLNKEFERKESRNMEIIGVFTAVITFVLSSIPAFKFVDNFYQAILFTLSIACSLGLFILIIFSLTRGAKEVFRGEANWILFLIVILLGVVTTYSLISFENKSVTGILAKEIKVNAESKLVDSLKKRLVQDLK